MSPTATQLKKTQTEKKGQRREFNRTCTEEEEKKTNGRKQEIHDQMEHKFYLKQDYMFAHTEHFRMPYHVIITYAQQTSIQPEYVFRYKSDESIFGTRGTVYIENKVENRYFQPNEAEHNGIEQRGVEK